MDYDFSVGPPMTEVEALAQVARRGFHAIAFDDSHDEDEPLHWHEFNSVAFVITGGGRIGLEDGGVLELQPGCRLEAPAGWLHQTLAGSKARIVIGTDLPGEDWTPPINKDPADLPAFLAS